MTHRHPSTIALHGPDAADLRRRGPGAEDDDEDRHPIVDAMGSAVANLCAVDVGETAAVLAAAAETVQAATAAAGLLALVGGADGRARWGRAAPLLETTAQTLEHARSFPPTGPPRPGSVEADGVEPDPVQASLLRQDLVDTALGLNLVLQWAAHYAAYTHDADACRRAATLATSVIDCFKGDVER